MVVGFLNSFFKYPITFFSARWRLSAGLTVLDRPKRWLTIVDLVKLKRTWIRQQYTGRWKLNVENIPKPLEIWRKSLFMTLQRKFFKNRKKRYTQSVHSVQWNSGIVIWRISSNSVNSGHILLIKKRTIHGCDTIMNNLTMVCWWSISSTKPVY